MPMRSAAIFFALSSFMLLFAGCPPQPAQIDAEFTAQPLSGTAPLEVTFTDQSTSTGAPITAWDWSFGDGGSSTEQNPAHTYLRAGKYSVILQVTSADGFDVRNEKEFIIVDNPIIAPEARFSATPLSGDIPLYVAFRDQSIPGSAALVSWNWDFGDGAASFDRHAVHIYTAPGVYTVSLTVLTAAGVDTETKTDYVNVSDPAVAVFGSSALEALVREALGQPSGPLMIPDIAALQTLDISGKGLTSLDGLAYCSGLTWLDLSDNQLTDLTPVADLTALRTLLISGNWISDLSPLAGLIHIEELDAGGNEIEDLSALANLTQLRRLWLYDNQIGDLYPLAGLTALETLDLNVNDISNIASLQGLTALQTLNLSNNTISSAGALAANTGLDNGDEVLLTGNPLDQAALCGDIPALLGRGVAVTFDGACAEGEGEGESPVMTLRRSITQTYPCQAGGMLEIAVTLEYEGAEAVQALGLVETLPWEWTFAAAVSGNIPDVITPRPMEGTVEFAWIDIPAFPITLVYRVTAPVNVEDQYDFSGQVLYRLSASELRSDIVTTSVPCNLIPEEGEGMTEGEGMPEGAAEGEYEGDFEGEFEGALEGEGAAEGELEGASEGEGMAEGETAEPVLSFVRNAPQYYTPGTAINVSVTITAANASTVNALALVETIPEGWAFGSVLSGVTPAVYPAEGTTGTLQFAWIAVPSFPAAFSYRIVSASTVSGPCGISGYLAYRGVGDQVISDDVSTTIRQSTPVEGEPQEGEGGAVEEMTFERNVPEEYVPGSTFDVTITILYSGEEEVLALGLSEHLPEGWTFDSLVSGTSPAVYPESGAAGTAGFAWVAVPAFPVTFTYRIAASLESQGTKTIDGYVIYRHNSWALYSESVSSIVHQAAIPEGEGQAEGEGMAEGEGEGSTEGEGVIEGEGVAEGEGATEGEGAAEGEGTAEGATEGEGAIEGEGEEEGSLDYDMILRRTVSGPYVPGGTVDVTLSYTYTGSEAISAFGVSEFTPPGWTFVEFVSGSEPAAMPNPDETGELGFAWIYPPAIPGGFTYRLRVPQTAAGPQTMEGYAIYRTLNPELRSNTRVTIINPAAE